MSANFTVDAGSLREPLSKALKIVLLAIMFFSICCPPLFCVIAFDGGIINGTEEQRLDKIAVMVHPERQRQGIGTQLLLAIEDEYPKQRYELFTSSKSKKNIELYERLGYHIFREEQITDDLKFVYLEKTS